MEGVPEVRVAWRNDKNKVDIYKDRRDLSITL
jgi:hypothetical protein